MAALPPGTLQLNIFGWDKMLWKYVKVGQPEKALQLFQLLQQQEGWVLTTSLLFTCLMHVLVYEHLERACMYMYRLLKAVVTQSMEHGGGLDHLQQIFPHVMWSLGIWQYWDMWNVGKGRKHRNFVNKYSRNKCNQLLSLLWEILCKTSSWSGPWNDGVLCAAIKCL